MVLERKTTDLIRRKWQQLRLRQRPTAQSRVFSHCFIASPGISEMTGRSIQCPRRHRASAYLRASGAKSRTAATALQFDPGAFQFSGKRRLIRQDCLILGREYLVRQVVQCVMCLSCAFSRSQNQADWGVLSWLHPVFMRVVEVEVHLSCVRIANSTSRPWRAAQWPSACAKWLLPVPVGLAIRIATFSSRYRPVARS